MAESQMETYELGELRMSTLEVDEAKVRNVFEDANFNGTADEFINLYKSKQTRPFSKTEAEIKARRVDTKDVMDAGSREQQEKKERMHTDFIKERKELKKWSEMDIEMKNEINSRLNAIPAPGPGKRKELIDEKVKEKLLRQEIKKVIGEEGLKSLEKDAGDNEKPNTPLGILKDEYKKCKYFSSHYTYDLVLVYEVGDEERQVTYQIKDTKSVGSKKKQKKYQSVDQATYFEEEIATHIGALRDAEIHLQVYYSVQKDEIYVLIGADEERLRLWAHKTGLDVVLDEESLIKEGLRIQFPLAIRMNKKRIAQQKKDEAKNSQDGDSEQTEDEEINKHANIHTNAFSGIYGPYHPSRKFQKLYQTQTGRDVKNCFRHPDTVFTNINRLKLTKSIIEAEEILGGASLNLDSAIADKNSPLIHYFPLHDHVEKKEIEMKLLRCCTLFREPQPIGGLREYFGEQVGMYFNFLQHYVMCLIPPSIVGLPLTLWQLGMDNYNIAGAPIFGFIMVIWSTFFLETWKRQTGRLRKLWGMNDFEDQETDRPGFDGDWEASGVTGEFEEVADANEQMKKLCLSTTAVFLYISIVIVSVTMLFILRGIIQASSDIFFVQKVVPPLLNSLVILLFNTFWGKTALWLTEKENLHTESQFENSLVTKTFLFKFVNSYISLFYIGFAKKYDATVKFCILSYVQKVSVLDVKGYWYERLAPNPNPQNIGTVDIDANNNLYKTKPNMFQNQSLWQNWACATGATAPDGSNNTLSEEISEHVCELLDRAFERMDKTMYNGWDYKGNCMRELGTQLITIFLTMMFVNNALELGKPIFANYKEKKAQSKGNENEERSTPEKESEFESYEGTFDDYDELVVQFGYVSLFVVAFPIIPFLAFLNNWLENWVDGSKLLKYSQRPHPKGAADIGTWYNILNYVSYMAIMTNVGLAFLNYSDLFTSTLGSRVGIGADSDKYSQRLLIFLAVEHTLIFSKLFVAAIIPDNPSECEEHALRTLKIAEIYLPAI